MKYAMAPICIWTKEDAIDSVYGSHIHPRQLGNHDRSYTSNLDKTTNVIIYPRRSKMGSIGLLNSSGRRLLLAAQGSLHSPCLYATRLYCRNRPTVEVKTSWRRTHMQRGVRGYANSFVDILKENESEGFREVNSGE